MLAASAFLRSLFREATTCIPNTVEVTRRSMWCQCKLQAYACGLSVAAAIPYIDVASYASRIPSLMENHKVGTNLHAHTSAIAKPLVLGAGTRAFGRLPTARASSSAANSVQHIKYQVRNSITSSTSMVQRPKQREMGERRVLAANFL